MAVLLMIRQAAMAMDITHIGIFATLFGTTFVAFGVLIQKYSHTKELEAKATDPPDTNRTTSSASVGTVAPERPYFLQIWWLLGISIFLFGHIICYVALGFAPQSVLSCLNVWTIVVTLVLAPVVLGERVGIRQILCVVIVVAGVVLVIIFGPKQDPRLEVEDVLHSLASPIFLIILGCSFLIGLATVLRPFVCETKRSKDQVALEYAFVAAMLAWYSVLCAKCSSGLLLHAIRDFLSAPTMDFKQLVNEDKPLYGMIPWFFVGAMVVLSLTNLHMVNMALRHGDGVLVVPVYESCSILGQVLLGGLFFGEFSRLGKSFVQAGAFVLGVTFVVSGNFFLASAQQEDVEDAPEAENTLTKVPDKDQAPNYGSNA